MFSVTSALNIKLVHIDPTSHLTLLRNHVASILQNPSLGILPDALLTKLDPLVLSKVDQTARSLANRLAHLSPEIVEHSSQPTACAVYIIALEAAARAALPNLGDLAHCLASKCSIGRSIVLKRYQALEDIILSAMEQLPWLAKYQQSNGRSKVAKRVVVARGVEDVIQWYDNNWKKSIEHSGRPTVVLQVDGQEDSASDEEGSLTLEPLLKRRKKQHGLDAAAQFLLDPLNAPLPTSSHEAGIPVDTSLSNPHAAFLSHLPLTSYILASPTFCLSLKAQPTRLQLLSVARGGSGTQEIVDDELFDPIEWASLWRSEEETKELEASGMFDLPESQRLAQQEKSKATRRKRKRDAEKTPSTKLNMDAFAQFMIDDDSKIDEEQLLGLDSLSDTDEFMFEDNIHVEKHEPYDDFQSNGSSRAPLRLLSRSRDSGAVILEDWRPPSPDGGGYLVHYDEEYD